MKKLTKKRKAEVLAYLERLPANKREAVRQQIVEMGGPEGKFLEGRRQKEENQQPKEEREGSDE